MEVYYAVQHYEIAELTVIVWLDDWVGNNICPRSMHAGLALGIRIPYVVLLLPDSSSARTGPVGARQYGRALFAIPR